MIYFDRERLGLYRTRQGGRYRSHFIQLRCDGCACLTLGCKDHWFCGMCHWCAETLRLRAYAENEGRVTTK